MSYSDERYISDLEDALVHIESIVYSQDSEAMKQKLILTIIEGFELGV